MGKFIKSLPALQSLVVGTILWAYSHTAYVMSFIPSSSKKDTNSYIINYQNYRISMKIIHCLNAVQLFKIL